MSRHNQDQLTEKIILMLKKKLIKEYSKGNTKRDAHAKCIGLLKAYFIVDKNLPDEYKVGIFNEYKTYPAIIRVSNSNPKIKSDKYRDFRGFSIKVLNVHGNKCTKDEKYTQDFLFINNEIMPIGTLKLFHDVIYYTTKLNPIILGTKFIFNGNFKAIFNSLKNMKHETSPLDVKYYSTTPYMFGDKKVKYALIPKSIYKSTLPKKLTPNYLTDNMQKHLKSNEGVFDFMIQIQTNDNEMPLNDASVKWDEKKSPFIKLGQIKIPAQVFTTRQRYDLAEILSFSPGHSLLDHRPIGDINIARIKIYEEMSKFRHNRNKKDLFEPNESYFNSFD